MQWKGLGHPYQGRSPEGGRDDSQPVVDSRDSLQGKGRERFGGMEIFNH